MKPTIKTAFFVLLTLPAFAIMSFLIPVEKPGTFSKNINPKIQAAILLDVSGSMEGLIEQAKAQLWNMVSVMGKAKCNGLEPKIEIALYEYGRSTNDMSKGYVKQISAFTSDLDKLSKELFSLRTNGGDEYCGQVIHTSLSELNWDPSPLNYKVIFIAGNEDFLQGKLHYSRACDEAKKKGVIVNTIYCGDQQQGIREHWNLAGECGNGSYTFINQHEKVEEIPTPFDSQLFTLNEELNGTYVYYGAAGEGKFADQAAMDKSNFQMSASVAAKRVAVKGKSSLYKNESWDLVDAYATDSTKIAKIDLRTLPKDLQGKSRAEVIKVVKEKNNKRHQLQKKITEINSKRESYIATEKSRSTKKTGATLESEVEKIIKKQGKRFNMVME